MGLRWRLGLGGRLGVGCRIQNGRGLGIVVGVFALAFGVQSLFQAIHTLQEGFEDVGLGASFLGDGVWRGGLARGAVTVPGREVPP